MLVQVAKTLISADDLETVLQKVMDMIFEYLPVDRGFLLLEEGGELKLRISRMKSGQRHDDATGAPPTRARSPTWSCATKVAVLTSDAQSDERFEAGQSIRMQQIRSAMCAPLWSRDSVIGVIQVDSPLYVGSFNEQDLDLLTALANFAAVAIERARLSERVAEEKRIRGRLERYHSPQVIDEIIGDAEATGGIKGVRTKTVTILFADLVGFTSWSEKMAAQELTHLLTRFFTLASDAVFSEDGTIDKFVGDAVMAFFGAPIDQPDHARRAASTALKLRDGMQEWNRERTRPRRAPARRSGRHKHGRRVRRRDRLGAPRGLHGDRQPGQRRRPHGGVRRDARRHRDRAGDLRGHQEFLPRRPARLLRPQGPFRPGPALQDPRSARRGGDHVEHAGDRSSLPRRERCERADPTL